MADLIARLKQRKIVQWAVAYVAGAWALLQVLDLAAGTYHWPDSVMTVAFGVLALGLVITPLLAWYHGERSFVSRNTDDASLKQYAKCHPADIPGGATP